MTRSEGSADRTYDTAANARMSVASCCETRERRKRKLRVEVGSKLLLIRSLLLISGTFT